MGNNWFMAVNLKTIPNKRNDLANIYIIIFSPENYTRG